MMLTALIHAVALLFIAATVLLIGVAPIYAFFMKDDPVDYKETSEVRKF